MTRTDPMANLHHLRYPNHSSPKSGTTIGKDVSIKAAMLATEKRSNVGRLQCDILVHLHAQFHQPCMMLIVLQVHEDAAAWDARCVVVACMHGGCKCT